MTIEDFDKHLVFTSYLCGSVAKNLAFLQNQKKPSQLGKLIIFIRKKMIHKGENYSVKMQKYYFCNGTMDSLLKNLFGENYPDRLWNGIYSLIDKDSVLYTNYNGSVYAFALSDPNNLLKA